MVFILLPGPPAGTSGSPADLRLHGEPQKCAKVPYTEVLLPLPCGYQTGPGEGGIRSETLPGSPPTDVLGHGCTDPMLQNRRHPPHTPRGGRHGLIDREARRLLLVRWPTLCESTPSPPFQSYPHEFLWPLILQVDEAIYPQSMDTPPLQIVGPGTSLRLH